MKKEDVVEMIRNGEKRRAEELFITDPTFTQFFIEIIKEIGEKLANDKIDRKIRRKLPDFIPVLKKVIEIPMESIFNFIMKLQGWSFTLPLSLFGGYWKISEEDVIKLFAIIRRLLTYGAIKARNDEERGATQAKKLCSFIFSFFLFLDEGKIVPSWRQLIENIEKPEFAKILREIFITLASLGEPVRLQFPLRMPDFKERLKETKNGIYEICLFVPTEKRSKVLQIYQDVVRKIEEENQWLEKFLLKTNIEKLKEKIPFLWQEIENPSYGLRPEGKDRIEIKIPEMNYSFYQILSFQFFPQEWPIVKVKVNLLFFDDYHFFFTLSPGATEIKGRVYLPEDPRKKFDFLLLYLATLSYWKIVTGKIFSEKGLIPTAIGTGSGEKIKTTYVRPHYRTLPKGWKSSEEAKSRALKILHQGLPPGKTFVRDYEKGKGEESKGPVTILTTQDLAV